MTTYFNISGMDLPSSIKSDMNTIMKRKLGITENITIAPDDWSSFITYMKPLPEKTASGAIAHFTDGADTVPLKSSKFYITPTQASGTPTPSNPLPITGWTGANVFKCGANFWDEETEKGRISTTTGENVPDNNYLRTVNYIPVKGGQSYKLYISGSTTKWAAVLTYDANKTFLANLGGKTGNSVITLNSDVAYIRFYLSDSYGTTYNNDVAFLYPSTLTDYAPYTATTYPVSWSEQGTVYGGYFKDGELWKTHELINLDSLSWAKNGQTITFYSEILEGYEGQTADFYCSCYEPTVNGGYNAQNLKISIRDSGVQSRIWIADNSYSTAAELIASLEGQTAALKLATPVKVADIDPLEIVSMLGVNNIWSDTGDSEVEYRADPALATQ